MSEGGEFEEEEEAWPTASHRDQISRARSDREEVSHREHAKDAGPRKTPGKEGVSAEETQFHEVR